MQADRVSAGTRGESPMSGSTGRSATPWTRRCSGRSSRPVNGWRRIRGPGGGRCPARGRRSVPAWTSPRSRRCAANAATPVRARRTSSTAGRGGRPTSASRPPTPGPSWRCPVIAAVHGHALGGGLQIALGADIRFVGPRRPIVGAGDPMGARPGHGRHTDAAPTAAPRPRQGVGLDRPHGLGHRGGRALGLATRVLRRSVSRATLELAARAGRQEPATPCGPPNACSTSPDLVGPAAAVPRRSRGRWGALIGSQNQLEAVRGRSSGARTRSSSTPRERRGRRSPAGPDLIDGEPGEPPAIGDVPARDGAISRREAAPSGVRAPLPGAWSRTASTGDRAFGIVLISRGSEVGGGDQRPGWGPRPRSRGRPRSRTAGGRSWPRGRAVRDRGRRGCPRTPTRGPGPCASRRGLGTGPGRERPRRSWSGCGACVGLPSALRGEFGRPSGPAAPHDVDRPTPRTGRRRSGASATPRRSGRGTASELLERTDRRALERGRPDRGWPAERPRTCVGCWPRAAPPVGLPISGGPIACGGMCLLVVCRGTGPRIAVGGRRQPGRDSWTGPPWSATVLAASRPGCIGGKDLMAGGTWLAVNEHGLVAGEQTGPRQKGRDDSKRSQGELRSPWPATPTPPTRSSTCHDRPLRAIQPSLAPGRRPRVPLLPRRRRGGAAGGRGTRPRGPRAGQRPAARPLPQDRSGPRGLRGGGDGWLRGALALLRAVLADHTVPPEVAAEERPPDRPAALAAACVHTEAFGTRSAALIRVPAVGRPSAWVADGPPCEAGFASIDALWTQDPADLHLTPSN